MLQVRTAGLRVVAWVLLLSGLLVIALNPGVPSLPYAMLWLGIMAVARGIATLGVLPVVGMDLSLLFVCVLGMEIGGLLLVPSVVAFTLADALRPEPASAVRRS